MKLEFKVTKCICYDTSFKEMKEIMIKQNLKTIDELRRVKPVGVNCRLCVPYIEKMIETGETEFKVIL
jgi:bacterioferritin-associated ferredoxin